MKRKELLSIIIKSLAIASIFLTLNTIKNYNNNRFTINTIESFHNGPKPFCCWEEEMCKNVSNDILNNNINDKYIAISNFIVASIGFGIGLIINISKRKKSKNKLYILSIFMAISGIIILLHSTYLLTSQDTSANYSCNNITDYNTFLEYKNIANKTKKISTYHMCIILPTYAIGIVANIIGNKKKKRKYEVVKKK